MLAAMGPAPPPEDNAAVDLLLLGLGSDDLLAVCTARGIAGTPPAEPLREPPRDHDSGITAEMWHAAVVRPWTGVEFPLLEAWLVAHDAALDRLVAAADRPRFWLPSLMHLERIRGWSDRVHDLGPTSAVTRLLVCRAMWHAGVGRHAAAWRDIRAVYRLARIMAASVRHPGGAPAPSCFPCLWMNLAADQALTSGLLHSHDLPADVLAAIQRDIDALAPLPRVSSDAMATRFDAIHSVVFNEYFVLRESDSRCADHTDRHRLLQRLTTLKSLDWNVVLERMNATFDRCEAAVRLPTFAAQRTELARLQEELAARVALSCRGSAVQVFSELVSRRHRSECVGECLVLDRVEQLRFWSDVLIAAHASFDLRRTAVALAAWKADRAAGDEPYPDTLDALVPRYLAAVPLDPYSDTPFVYGRRDAGYLLASVGWNGVYDGGDDEHGWIVDGEWQATRQNPVFGACDIVVRMPMPPRPLPQP